MINRTRFLITTSSLFCFTLSHTHTKMGSRKFSTFLCFVCCIGITWEILLSGFLLPSNADSFGSIRSSGPYSLLGAMLYLFHKYTPRLHPRIVSVLGFELSEKVSIDPIGISFFQKCNSTSPCLLNGHAFC